MGKSAQEKPASNPVKADIAPSMSTPVQPPAFSNGDLGQLQEILFGAQQRTTNDQIAALQNQMNEQIQTLGNMLNSRINLLTESIDKKANEHEQLIGEIRAEQQASVKALAESMDDKKQQLESTISMLGKSTGEEAARVQSELKSTEKQLQTQLQDTQNALQLELKSSVEQLKSKTLDKKSLAKLLGDMSEQITNAEFVDSDKR